MQCCLEFVWQGYRRALRWLSTRELRVALVSGEHVGTCKAFPAMLGKDVRAMVLQSVAVPAHMACIKLCRRSGRIAGIVEDDKTLAQMGWSRDSYLEVSFKGVYVVQGAGVPDVNGTYNVIANEYHDSVPCYCNDAGTLLFRYRMRSGMSYWYFSEGTGNLNQAAGDYYRVQSGALTPPEAGWTTSSCSAGLMPVPRAIYRLDGAEAVASAPSPKAGWTNEQPVEEHEAGEVESQFVHLDVSFMSGERIAKLTGSHHWTIADIKAALRPHMQPGVVISQLLFLTGADVLEDDLTLKALGVDDECSLVAIAQHCHYFVQGAGTSIVNGPYRKTTEIRNDANCFENDQGIILFRYRFENNGALYWYFSDKKKDLSKKEGDFYRVKSDTELPPLTGWTQSHCPLGEPPTPTLLAFGVDEDETEASESSSDDGSDQGDLTIADDR